MIDDLFGFAPPKRAGIEDMEIPGRVFDKFEELSLQVAKAGFTHYSADAILHRIRWHYHMEMGHRNFKCNNNWTSVLARWFLKRHPELSDFFELRSSPS